MVAIEIHSPARFDHDGAARLRPPSAFARVRMFPRLSRSLSERNSRMSEQMHEKKARPAAWGGEKRKMIIFAKTAHWKRVNTDFGRLR
jgi:hypothetical protein